MAFGAEDGAQFGFLFVGHVRASRFGACRAATREISIPPGAILSGAGGSKSHLDQSRPARDGNSRAEPPRKSGRGSPKHDIRGQRVRIVSFSGGRDPVLSF
jgi:hypothetical protein